MKTKFLVKISRLMIVMLLLSGLPAAPAKGANASGSNSFENGVINFSQALNDYNTLYAPLALANSLANISNNYLLLNPSPAAGTTALTAGVSTSADGGQVILPFSTTSGSDDSKSAGFGYQSPSIYFQSGDFQKAITSPAESEQLIRSYIQYMYNVQTPGSLAQQNVARYFAYIILYAALSPNQYFNGQTGATFTPTYYDLIALTFSSNGTPYSPAYSNSTIQSLTNGSLQIAGSGGLTFNANFTQSAQQILNLLVNASFSSTNSLSLPAVSDGDSSLYNLISQADWSQFNAIFSNSSCTNGTSEYKNTCSTDAGYTCSGTCPCGSTTPQFSCNAACGVGGNSDCSPIIGFAGTLQQIAKQNLYYNCNIDTSGNSVDESLYYADPTTIQTKSISLIDQIGSDYSAASNGATLSSSAQQNLTTIINNLLGSAANTTYNYLTGKFYLLWPNSYTNTSNITISDPGAVLNNWSAVCQSSSAQPATATVQKQISTILSSVQKYSGPATCQGTPVANDGTLHCLTSTSKQPGQTLQDAEYNLLSALTWAATTTQVSSKSSLKSGIAPLITGFAPTTLSKAANINPLELNGQPFDPNVLATTGSSPNLFSIEVSQNYSLISTIYTTLFGALTQSQSSGSQHFTPASIAGFVLAVTFCVTVAYLSQSKAAKTPSTGGEKPYDVSELVMNVTTKEEFEEFYNEYMAKYGTSDSAIETQAEVNLHEGIGGPVGTRAEGQPERPPSAEVTNDGTGRVPNSDSGKSGGATTGSAAQEAISELQNAETPEALEAALSRLQQTQTELIAARNTEELTTISTGLQEALNTARESDNNNNIAELEEAAENFNENVNAAGLGDDVPKIEV